MKRLLVLLATAAAAVGGIGGAQVAGAGTAAPNPCTVSYAAHATAGLPVVGHLAASCNPDEVSSVATRIVFSGPPQRACSGGGTTGVNLTCSFARAQKAHAYLLQFDVTVRGNFLSCADDGVCDTPVSHDPHCTVRTAADQSTDPTAILDCVYASVVAVP
jgi:hypothetical protein